MRTFEILVILLWSGSLLRLWWVKGRPQFLDLAGAGALVLLLGAQFLVDRPRLVLAPVYLGIVIHVGLLLIRVLRGEGAETEQDEGRRKRGWLSLVLGTLGVVVAASPGLLFPVPTLPTPTGPYAIGLTRQELVAGDRHLAVDLWYPARPQPGTTPMPPWSEVLPLAGELTSQVGLGWIPTQLFDQVNLTNSHTWRDAPLLEGGPLPVLLFSPGYGSVLQTYAGILETMVSHGYVVVSVAHPGQNLIVYPDGRYLPFTSRNPPAVDEQMNALYQDMLKANDDDETWKSLMARNWQLRRQTTLPADLQLWAQDSRFVLDRLPQLSAERFGGRLDLNRIGAFGHSFGGATAGELVLTDPRVRAGANLDGTQEGTVLDHPLPGSFLLIEEGLPAGRIGNIQNRMIYAASPGPFYTLDVAGAFHSNFGDIALFSPVFSWLGLTGPVDAVSALQTTNQFLVAFFDQELNGKASALLAADSQTPQYSFTRRVP